MASRLNKILFVEDDPMVAELAVMAMQEFGGLKLHHCISGADAVAQFHEFAPDMLLLDVMMPEMDGPETLRRIRALPNGSTIPAVFMTAKSQAHEQEAYLQFGAIGIIPKPFDPLTLPDKLAEYWHQDSSAK